VLANPPFNDSDWGGELLKDDKRWKYGVPPAGNANFAWVQHFIHHLAPTGLAGFVLANGSMSSNQSGEGEIRKAIVEADLVDCMVALPGQLFYSTQIPVCLWFLARDKKKRARLPRPARRDAVHRRAQARHDGRPHPPRADGRRHREDRRHLPRLARRQGRGAYAGRAGLLQERHARRDPQARPRADARALRRRRGAEDDGEPFDEKMEQQAEAAKLDWVRCPYSALSESRVGTMKGERRVLVSPWVAAAPRSAS
jgi:type I restriction enzyme M protein